MANEENKVNIDLEPQNQQGGEAVLAPASYPDFKNIEINPNIVLSIEEAGRTVDSIKPRKSDGSSPLSSPIYSSSLWR